MYDRLTKWATSLMLASPVVFFCGCQADNVLRSAGAVQLETALISMMNTLLRSMMYGAMGLPRTTFIGYMGL